MALKLKKAGAPADSKTAAPAGTETPEKEAAPKKSMSFVKTGAEAKQLREQKEAEAEAAKAEYSKARRFFISKSEADVDKKITFLDGSLDDDGMLALPTWVEHTVMVGGRLKNIVCTKDMEGHCPLCDADDRPSLVSGFSIIDHSSYTPKTGANAGKTVKDTRKLYVVKPTALKMLQKLAGKNNGLVGLTVEVSRSGPKSPGSGDMFHVVEKTPLGVLKKTYGDQATPADFNEELTYIPASELQKLVPKGGFEEKTYDADVAGDDELDKSL